MLTKADDFPIHQTAEPNAFSGTDRNFYDRYFFNGYSPDGRIFFAIAFGVYPHANVADAHFAIAIDGVEHYVHASRELLMERMDLQVGPIRIVVEEPLVRLRVIVGDETGIAADIVFEGRSVPIEEPRFTYRHGPRTLMDYTRMTQNCRCSGWVEIDRKRVDLPAGTLGTRDRSWGVRPLGASDPQPLVPAMQPSFFWRWIPMQFESRSVCFHLNADTRGHVWNSRAAIVPDGGTFDDIVEIGDATLETRCSRDPGTQSRASCACVPRVSRRSRSRSSPCGPISRCAGSLFHRRLDPWHVQRYVGGRARDHRFAAGRAVATGQSSRAGLEPRPPGAGGRSRRYRHRRVRATHPGSVFPDGAGGIRRPDRLKSSL